MPRANRYILPEQLYHVTHRCHDRAFLLRFKRDRNEYRTRLRAARIEHRVTILTYTITSNHVHLVAGAAAKSCVAAMMQQLEGEFARSYNRRKRRSGAYWEGRYHATMIEGGVHLWNCMVYVDLNMVRVGAVGHPCEWPWCGYQELTGRRTRYRITEPDVVREFMLDGGADELGQYYEECIQRGLELDATKRDAMWTESIAVGSQAYVEAIARREPHRRRLTIETDGVDRWCLRERRGAYD
jgi:putative transposase